MPPRSDLPGGLRLRLLREEAGRTQLWVELESDLGTGYLQRVESGKVAQPSRPTLERILNALDVPYAERREIMAAFGYATPSPPPSDEEVRRAATAAEPELLSVPFPAYVLDCLHRLVAWNAYFPTMLDGESEDPVLGQMANSSMLAPWFDPESPLGRMVVEPEAFLPALIRALRFEMQLVNGEQWHEPLLDELQSGSTLFDHYWNLVQQEPPPASSARPAVPVKLRTSSGRRLQFRLSAERFAQDVRFRFIYYFPADFETMALCAEWGRSLELLEKGESHSFSSTATTVPR